MSDQLNALRDNIASTGALIDQAQAHFDATKHLLTEEAAWYVQAELDEKRFALEINKLTVKALTRT